MRLAPTAIFLLALLAASGAGTASADQENDRLRAENLRLKAQLQALPQGCLVQQPAQSAIPASSAAAPPVANTAAPTGTGSVAAAAAPALPEAPAKQLEPVPPPPQAAVIPPAVAVPPGYKLVPANTPEYVDPLAPPYNRTGCSRDLFKGPPPAKWNDIANWSGIRRGLTTAEVEAMLGKEHFDASGYGRLEWQFGKCGDSVAGRVRFQNGQVVFWQVPDL